MNLTNREIYKSLTDKLSSYHDIMNSGSAIIAYSGGRDSSLLLDYYIYLFETEVCPPPIIYHLDHQIRNNKNQELEIIDYLHSIKKDHPRIIIYCKSKNIPGISKKIKKSLEETGRLIRYHDLNRLAKKHSGYIATGHHNKDYMESVLIHWIRGGGKKALETMPIFDGKTFRPLMKLEDADWKSIDDLILNSLNIFNIWEDETNKDTTYLRNRIRAEIIPFLEKENFQFKKFFDLFHEDYQSEIKEFSNQKQFLKIPKDTLDSIRSILDWKTLLDLHLRLLQCHPAKKTTIEQSFTYILKGKNCQLHTSEFILSGVNSGDIYIFPRDSKTMKMPSSQIVDGHLIVNWNGMEKTIDTTSLDIRNLTVSGMNPSEKINLNGMRKDISEVYRANGIPKQVRPFIPILRNKEEPIQILLSLFENSRLNIPKIV